MNSCARIAALPAVRVPGESFSIPPRCPMRRSPSDRYSSPVPRIVRNSFDRRSGGMNLPERLSAILFNNARPAGRAAGRTPSICRSTSLVPANFLAARAPMRRQLSRDNCYTPSETKDARLSHYRSRESERLPRGESARIMDCRSSFAPSYSLSQSIAARRTHGLHRSRRPRALRRTLCGAMNLPCRHPALKKRGRPRIDSEAVNVRLERWALDALDAWIAKQREPQLTRPAAIRRLLQKVLGTSEF
jgi:hypothetical protein